MADFLNEQFCEADEYDEKLTVEFKSGVEIDIESQLLVIKVNHL
ncbi:hypothetical protein [Anaerovirgula multivorans]|nr:hypothetical protein [Anaerovirgula multivorans]